MLLTVVRYKTLTRYTFVTFIVAAMVLPAGTAWGQQLIKRDASVDQSSRLRYEYKLGPNDQLTIQVADDEEFTGKPTRINSDGTVSVPLIGRVQAAGRTVADLEDEIKRQLSGYFVKPQVTVAITEYRSQPVSVLGYVNKPGLFQLDGPRSVAQMIALAGGIREDAGYAISLTRESQWGDIPIKGAISDPTHTYNTVKIPLSAVTNGSHPEANILVKPFDVISIPKGELIYVMGEVPKAGGFVLKDEQSVSVLEAVAMAGGYNAAAAPKRARILRNTEGSTHRTELPIDIRAIAYGKADDIRMEPQDILYIPNDQARQLRTRVIETAIGVGTGLLIWRQW